MTLAAGTPAPAFELTDQNRNQVSLEDLKGRKSLIVFIPFPFTGICDGEACAIRDGLGELEGLDANVVVITTHAVATNAKWAEEYGFTFPILSDYWPHGEVTRAYDDFNEDRGVAMRASFVLDADGVIRDVIETESLGVAREHELQVEALAAV
jgi:peroxiredoxin (alkyl hydroperoxide reductase subunit C)